MTIGNSLLQWKKHQHLKSVTTKSQSCHQHQSSPLIGDTGHRFLNYKRPVIVYFNPEQDRKAAVINPSGFKNFWGSKNSGAKKSGEIQCEIIRTKKRKKSKTNQNSDRSNDNKDQESFI